MPQSRRNSNQDNNNPSVDMTSLSLASHEAFPCSMPKGCLFGNAGDRTTEHSLIDKDELNDAVKVVCSNENCEQSGFLHSACFEAFEDLALQCLKTCSKAKGWSDKQKLQNLWTKRGFDLVYKACECNCGMGHVKKDLEWSPEDLLLATASAGKRKRKKSKTQMGTKIEETQQQPSSSALDIRRSDAQNISGAGARYRHPSMASTSSSGGSFGSSGSSSNIGSPPSNNNHLQSQDTNNIGAELYGQMPQPSLDGAQRPTTLDERMRHDSGGSIFQRRLDYSSFNALPKHKINSYHIKMEDECSIGNDETRIFILSSYASNKMNRVPCVVCAQVMTIYDRYPLIDGTFFLTPRQYNKNCVQVKVDGGKTPYLTAVCMGCLEGWVGGGINCRFCLKPWTGAHLILGTMYSYDIFAAIPCCSERLKCNTCNQLVIHPEQRFSFFSDYSQMVSCPNCGTQEFHFCKSLNVYIRGTEAKKLQQQRASIDLSSGGSGTQRVHRVNSA